MNNSFKIFLCCLGLVLMLAPGSDLFAQKRGKSKKEIQKEQGKVGPGGLVKGVAPQGNPERKLLLERQHAMDQAKANGYSSGASYRLPKNDYETGKGRFVVGRYEPIKVNKKKKKSKRLVDKENPDGKMYADGVRKRERKFWLF